MEGAKILELVMFWIFEKGTSVITFNPVGLAMPEPGFDGGVQNFVFLILLGICYRRFESDQFLQVVPICD